MWMSALEWAAPSAVTTTYPEHEIALELRPRSRLRARVPAYRRMPLIADAVITICSDVERKMHILVMRGHGGR
jgi:hypothetical protein